jgi:hypothetical protein
MLTLKGNMIVWGKCNLSFTNRILIVNQILFSSMWYMAAIGTPIRGCATRLEEWYETSSWGGKGLQHMGQGQMGFSYTPFVWRWPRDHWPQGIIRSAPCQTSGERTCPKRRTSKRYSETPNRSSPSPGAQQKAKHLGHKLAFYRPVR